MKPRFLLGLAACSLPFAASAEVIPIPWVLYEDPCSGGAAEVVFSCGRYGRFLVRESSSPSGCIEKARSAEVPPAYPTAGGPRAFPFPALRFRDLTPPTLPSGGPRTLPGSTTNSTATTWINVIDFDNEHGESTTWLAGRVAGTSVRAALAPLDDPALETLGPVGDLHVLARVCETLQAVDYGGFPPPITVNMSFGRMKLPTDPSSTACTSSSVACQIAHVAAQLRARGSTLVAAAGNHGAEMFPGALEEIVAAGMLDGSYLVQKDHVRPAWETPAAADAWIPGNGLCLDDWSAPAGSSYSSALLAGWLVPVLQRPDILAGLGPGPWQPMWHTVKECWVLGRGVKMAPWCNGTVTDLIRGLKGDVVTSCVSVFPTVATAPPPGRSHAPAVLRSIDERGAPTHPTPESDPCVPCSGVVVTSEGDDLQIDLSQSGPLPDGVAFDAVELRVDDGYFTLALTEAELEQMRLGELSKIVVPDGGLLFTNVSSLSLWYRLRDAGTTDCETQECYWSSTPLLIK